MKNRITLLAAVFLLLTAYAACSQLKVMTAADREYLFLPVDIEPFPFKNYHQEKAWDDVPYLFFTKYSARGGFTAVYGTILSDPEGNRISFLCSVNIEQTVQRATQLYSGMVPEHSVREFGRELSTNPSVYKAEKSYLYVSDTGYFHLVLQSSRIVYSIVLDGALIDEPHVRNNLARKLDYIRRNLNSIQ